MTEPESPAIEDPIDPLAHQGLIGDVAKKYLRRGLELEDLMQEGNLGLLRAIPEFDPSREVAFYTHAKYWIRDAIDHAVHAQARPIRIPRYLRRRIRKGATPDDPGLKPRRRACLRAASLVLSAERADEDMFPLWVRDKDPDEPSEVLALLEFLDSRERAVLTMRFGLDGDEPLTCREIAEQIGLTKQRVSQIASGALAKLRDAIESREDCSWPHSPAPNPGPPPIPQPGAARPPATATRSRLLLGIPSTSTPDSP